MTPNRIVLPTPIPVVVPVCSCCLAAFTARCLRCEGPACLPCDRCHGCWQVLCETCNADPAWVPELFPGDRWEHPHNLD